MGKKLYALFALLTVVALAAAGYKPAPTSVPSTLLPTKIPYPKKGLVLMLGNLAYAMPGPQRVNGEEVLSLEVGSEPGQVGFTPEGPEIFPLGPESFDIGKDGTIYLLDSTNHRIQCFDSEGNLRSIIPLQVRGVDLRVAEDNTFYVLDETRRYVLKVDREGMVLDTYEISKDIEAVSGISLDRRGDLILKVAEIEEYKLTSATKHILPDRQFQTKHEGLTTPRIEATYVFKRLDERLGHRGVMRVFDTIGNLLLEVPITTEHLLGSVVFVNTDRDGNIYLAVEELLEAPIVTVEKTVRKYDPNGKLLGIARLPIEEYYTCPNTEVRVDEKGNIYHLVPSKDRVKLLKLSLSQEFTSSLGKSKFVKLPKIEFVKTALACDGTISRGTVLSTARSYVTHSWYCNSNNYYGTGCSGRTRPPYLPGPNQWVTSIPYQWGGFDTVVGFVSKMGQNAAAGDADGDPCTCPKGVGGVDCSGYVSRCWDLCQKRSTEQLDDPDISDPICSPDCLYEADILVKPGRHVVLVSTVYSSGVSCYESTIDNGGHVGVMYRTWSWLVGYGLYRYKKIIPYYNTCCN
jgi:hypothetical protein